MTARTHHPMASPFDLQNGDVLTGEEFHQAYEAHPDDTRFELVEGVVHMASPSKLAHSNGERLINALTLFYEGMTPGIHGGNSATVKLSTDTELQPDGFLRIRSEFDGQTSESPDGYLLGPPEFVIEVSNSSRTIDLNAKRIAYSRYGVLEYLVMNLRDECFDWFDLRTNSPMEIAPDGICRVRTFPGLWLDSQAILRYDIRRADATLRAGLASAEHQTFVEELASRRQRNTEGGI